MLQEGVETVPMIWLRGCLNEAGNPWGMRRTFRGRWEHWKVGELEGGSTGRGSTERGSTAVAFAADTCRIKLLMRDF